MSASKSSTKQAVPQYLSQMVGNIHFKVREQRSKKNPKTKEKKYFIAYGTQENNLSNNLGDLERPGSECVILTKPSLYPGAPENAAKSMLIAFDPSEKPHLDYIRGLISKGIIANKAMGALTIPVLYDPDAEESKLERIYKEREDADRPAMSVKVPNDTKFFQIVETEDGRRQVQPLDTATGWEQLQVGTRFICKINWASLHTVGDTIGCSRYLNWVAFMPREARREDEDIVLGMGMGVAEVVAAEPAAAAPAAEDGAGAAAAAGAAAGGDLAAFNEAIATGFGGDDEEGAGDSVAKRARMAGL